MRPFTRLSGVAVALLRDNIDTDAIIPSREIRSVSKAGLAAGLFAGWRYLQMDERVPNPSFCLNLPDTQSAQILLAGDNFGCGSSREHAVWALAEYGFRVVIAPSFNSIFFRNCIHNGLLPATLPADAIRKIAEHCALDPQSHLLAVDLEHQSARLADGRTFRFEVPAHAKDSLILGWDAIDRTLMSRAQIEAFRAQDRIRRPWVY